MKEKIRFQMRISPETDQRVKAAIPLSNCRSQNEFVEQALNHYCACLQAQDSSSILAPALVNAVRAAVQNSENHISRLLFKLAVNNTIDFYFYGLFPVAKPFKLRRSIHV